MKKLIKILGLLFLIIILLLILIPILYKKEIYQKVQKAASEQINGKLEFNDLSLSLLKHFPKASISLDKLSIHSYATIDSAEILAIDKLDLAFDFWNLFNLDKGIEIKKLFLDHPVVNININNKGLANYDIIKSSGNSSSNSTPLNLKLQDYSIKNGYIKYKDDSSNLLLKLSDLNHFGKGSFNNNILDLNTKTTIDSINLTSQNIKYLHNVKLVSDLEMTIDQNKSLYTFKQNNIKLNDLNLNIKGFTQLFDDGKITMDLDIANPSSSFKELFSLIPNAYTKDYSNIKAEGDYELKGKINGDFHSEKNIYPSWLFKININNGGIQYPDMPASIKNVDVKLESKNDGPSVASQSLTIAPFHFLMNNKPVDGNLQINNLGNNPHVKGNIKADISLEDFSKVMPLEKGISLNGNINTDLQFDFTEDQINNKDYANMKLNGFANIQSLSYLDPTMPSINIPAMSINFTPNNIDVKNSQINLGKSDLNLNATFLNPLAILSTAGECVATINLNSNNFDINEWSQDQSSTKEEESSTAPEFLKNMKLDVIGNFKNIQYETYNIKNLNGKINFQNDNLKIVESNLQLNDDALQLNGSLSPLMAFVYQNNLLKGNLNINGPEFNLTKFLGEETTNSESTSTENFEVPKGMDIGINFNINKLLYDKVTLNQLKGNLQVANDEIKINNMTTSAMGGQMALSGSYNSADITKPSFDLKYDLKSIQFPKAFEQILSFKQLAPVAKFIEGIFNSTFTAKGILGKNMMPDLNSLTASGIIETVNGAIKGYKPIEALASKLNLNDFKTLNIQNTKNWFTVENGTVSIKEMHKTVQDIDVNISGQHKISGGMDYNFKMRIPRNKLNQNPVGATAETGIAYLKSLGSKAGINIETGSHVNVLVNLTGILNDPKISVKLLGSDGQDLEESAKGMINDVAKKAEDSIRNRANQELDKAKSKALAEAKRIEDSLRIVANKKVEEAKQKAIDKVADEAKKHVDTAITNKGKEILEDKLGKEAGKVLGEGGKKEVDKAKEKLKNWDPFKKKDK